MAPQSFSAAVDDEDPDKSPVSDKGAQKPADAAKGSAMPNAELAGSGGQAGKKQGGGAGHTK